MAHPELHDDCLLNYDRWPPSAHVIGLPYYGGARGQLLQITRDQNGAILNQVVVPVVDPQQSSQTFFQTPTYQNPMSVGFDMNFYNLQSSAKRLVDLQQLIQKTGQLMPNEKEDFATNLALLGQSATMLAEYQTGGKDLATLLGAQGSKRTQANKKNGQIPNAEQFEEDVS